jgi:hypothetical protein|uniref:Uncharacterized protein n=1 Tax=Desulfobacca acetoxidans TaxID=60893 RepID=A0A7C3WM28_9BACT
MGRKSLVILCLLGMFAIIVFSGADATTPSVKEPPYVGVIRNFTKHDISFYSENSQGIVTVPAKGWVEYVVWHENFELLGYLKGDPYFCKKMEVQPGQFQFNCKSYDFMAIIGTEEPKAVEGLG